MKTTCWAALNEHKNNGIAAMNSMIQTTPSRLCSALQFAATLAVAVMGAAVVGALMQPALAQTAVAEVVAAGSQVAFSTRQLGVPVEGRFSKFNAQVARDPRKPETGRVSSSLGTASARFGSAELVAEVPKPEWLSAARFPKASFLVDADRKLTHLQRQCRSNFDPGVQPTLPLS